MAGPDASDDLLAGVNLPPGQLVEDQVVMHPTELLNTTTAAAPTARRSSGPAPVTTDRADRSSYDERFDELAALAYRLAFRIVGRREEARDLAQEAMARAFAHWPRIEDKAAGWVGRVVTNLALDVVRRRKHRDPAPPDRSPDLATAAIQRAELVTALRSLSRRQRDVVVLRYLADLSERDTARALGCSTGAVKKHASRGLATLRAALTEPLPTDALPLDSTEEAR